MGEAQQLEALAYSNMEIDATGTIILIPQEASGLLIGDALVSEDLLPADTPLVCQEPCVEVASAPQPSASQCLFQGIAEVTHKKRSTLSPRIVTRAAKMRWLDELLEQKQIACPIAGCLACFSSMSMVERHYLSCPGVDGSGMEKCPYCDEQFLTLSNALQEHIPEEHPTMKALLHSEAPRKKPPGTYRRRKAPTNNEPPAKKAPDLVPSTREFEVRRRTYSRAWDQPVGPTSELFRRPQQEDDDPLQLPRDCVNQQDITMSSEELALDENQLAEDGQPSSHDSSLSILDTASLPRVPLRQPTPRPRYNRATHRRPSRPPNSRTVQVIVRSEHASSDLLRDPQLLDALGDLATRTEQPQDRVAVHAAATAGGRYLQTEMAQRPILERSEVDRFFGVVKVDSACQTDDLPLQRPRVSPAILKKAAPRVCSVPAQVATPATPATPTTIPKSIAVSIVCANRGYSSDEEDFSTPVPCPQGYADHALLHLPASLQHTSVANAPVVEYLVEEEHDVGHHVEPVACGVTVLDCVPSAEGATEETQCSGEHSAELDTHQSQPMDETEADSESAMRFGTDSTEGVLVQGFVANPKKDTVEDVVPRSVAIPIQVYTEGAQVQDPEANPIQNDTKEAVVLDSLGNPNQDSTEGALMQDSVSNPIQNNPGESPVMDSIDSPNQDSTEGALMQDSVANPIQNNTKEGLVMDSINNPNPDSTEGALVQNSVASPIQSNTEESMVLDSIDNPNQEAIVQDSITNPMQNNTEALVLDSVNNPSQDSIEEVVMHSPVVSSIHNDTEEGHVPDYLSNLSQGSTEGALLHDYTTSPIQKDPVEVLVTGSQVELNQSATKDLIPDPLISPIRNHNEQVQQDDDIKMIGGPHSDHSKGIEDNNLQAELSPALDVEPGGLQCAPIETACVNEARTQSICVSNELREEANTTVAVASRVLSADLTVSMEPYEEQQVVTHLEPISRVRDEKSVEGTEHPVDQSVRDYNTKETTVGHCLQSTAEIAPSLVAPDTELVTVPHGTELSVQPCTEINLPAEAMHVDSTESADKAKSISEFCDHIDASAQVWVAKMKEQLNVETEMEYELRSHTQIVTHKEEVFANIDALGVQPSGTYMEQAIHGELHRESSAEAGKGDACSNPHTEFEATDGTQKLPVDCRTDVEHPSTSDMPAIEPSYVTEPESEPEAGCDAKPATECHEPPSIAQSTQDDTTETESHSPYCEKSEDEAHDCNLLPKICSESEVINQGEVTVDTITCVDSAQPVHEMQCEEQNLSVGFVDSSHTLPSSSLEIRSAELHPEALKIEYVEEIHTNPGEMNPQPEVDTQPVEMDTQQELAEQPLQIDSQAKVDTRTLRTDAQPEIDILPLPVGSLPVVERQSVEIDHLSGITQPVDRHSGTDTESEGPGSPLTVDAQPMEMDFHSETGHNSVAMELETHTQPNQVDAHQTIDAESVEITPKMEKHSKEAVGTASETCPMVAAECEKASQRHSKGSSVQEEKIGTESALDTKEDWSGEKKCTDSETKGDVVEEQKTEVNVTNIDIEPGDGVELPHTECVLEKTSGSPCERVISVEGKETSQEGMDPGWVDEEDDTRSSGEALLHIVESLPDESSPLEESNQPEEDHFLGASGGRSGAASNATKTPKAGVKRKAAPIKKKPGKTVCRRKPLFQLNLDFPDGAPLKCSACKTIFTEKTLIVEHILHAHYNLARVNDEREMSDAERRSALLQASKVISRFECKNDGCDASFATHISYYTHHSRCSMADTSPIYVPKSKPDQRPVEEDNHEGPRKKRRSALKAMKSFTNMTEERPSSRESQVTQFSDESSAMSLSDDPLSDWSISSGEEDSLSVLQSWRGRFKGPEGCGEKLPEDVIKGWVKGSPCPNKGCPKEFQTLLGLKYHYPRCSQGSFYECCRCGLGGIKHSWAMLRHLRTCYLDRPKGDISKKKAKGKMQSRRPCELHQNTVDFREKHYTKEMLYKEWQPSKWQPLSKSEAELYLPVFRESPALRLSDTTWKTMKLFEVSHQRVHSTLFVGGAVWAAAWCPVPEDAAQWVALACCPDPDTEWPLVAVDQLPCTRGLLQIWCLGKLKGPDFDPKPALLLGHDWGPITDIVWCPSGCWEPPGTGHRLGLLALACVDGSVRILSVPHEIPTGGDIVVHGGVVPSVTLESPAGASLCSRLAWYPARSHSLFAAGYGNGMVSLFDLQTSSVLLRGTAPDGSSMLQPCQVIQAHVAAITGLAWSHCTHEPFLASASIDRSAKLWCMNDPAAPVTLFRRGMLRSLAMCQHWNGMFLAGDETYTNSRVVTLYKENGYFNYVPKSLTSNSYTSWWVSVSEWLNMAAACDVGGHVSAISLPFLSGNLDSNKKHSRGRVFIYQTNMVPLDASLPTPQDATSHAVAVKHFGLAFQDSPLNSWSSNHDAKDYTASPNQYHLNSINTVSWNPNGLLWLLSGGQAGIVRLSWLGLLAGKRFKPP